MASFRVGAQVTITSGKYAGLSGTVSMIDREKHPNLRAVLLQSGTGADGVDHAGNVIVDVSEMIAAVA